MRLQHGELSLAQQTELEHQSASEAAAAQLVTFATQTEEPSGNKAALVDKGCQ